MTAPHTFLLGCPAPSRGGGQIPGLFKHKRPPVSNSRQAESHPVAFGFAAATVLADNTGNLNCPRFGGRFRDEKELP